MRDRTLNALNLNAEDQARLITFLPEIRQTAENQGSFEFSGDRAIDYTNLDIGQVSGTISKEILKSFNMKLRYVVWIIFALLSSILNCSVTYAMASDQWGESSRLGIAAFASLGFVLFADFLIARLVKASRQSYDARLERKKLDEREEEEKKDNLNKPLKRAFMDGKRYAFQEVQASHLTQRKIESYCIYVYLVAYIASELGTAIHRSLNIVGQDFTWGVIAAPLLGALLNVMTAWLRGTEIAYPTSRYALGTSYFATHSSIGVSLVDEIWLMNQLTETFLRKLVSSAEEMTQAKNFILSNKELKMCIDTYQSQAVQLDNAHTELIQELNRSSIHHSQVRSEINKLNQVHAEKSLILSKQTLDLLQSIKEEAESKGTSTERIDAFYEKLESKIGEYTRKRDNFEHDQTTLVLGEQFEEIQQQYRTEFAQQKKIWQQDSDDIRQSSLPQSTMRFELNQRESRYVNEQIATIEEFQHQLESLQQKFQQARIQTTSIDKLLAIMQRDVDALNKTRELLDRKKIGLEYRAEFEKLRSQHDSDLKQLRSSRISLEDKCNTLRQDAASRQQSVGFNHETEFQLALCKGYLECEEKAMQILSERIARLVELRDDMEHSGEFPHSGFDDFEEHLKGEFTNHQNECEILKQKQKDLLITRNLRSTANHEESKSQNGRRHVEN